MSKSIKTDRLKSNIQTLQPRFMGDDDDQEEVRKILELIKLQKVPIELNEFDNDYTTKVKMAIKHGLPSMYIRIDSDTDEPESLFSYFTDLQPTTASLEDVYDLSHEVFHWVPLQSWAMIFANQFQDTATSDEDFLEQINGFLENHGHPLLKNQGDLENHLRFWVQNYDKAIYNDYTEVENIVQSQKFLATQKPLLTSPLIINTERYEFTIKAKKTQVLSLFYDAKLNLDIPWIISTIDTYSTVPPKNTPATSDAIMMRVIDHVPDSAWALRPTEDLLAYHLYFCLKIDKNYTVISIDLSILKMVLDVPILEGMDQATILKRITTALPISIESSQQKNINATFNVYAMRVMEYSFAEVIMMDDLFNTFLIMDELVNPLSNKKRFTIQFKPAEPAVDLTSTAVKSSVNATLNQVFSVAGQAFPEKAHFPPNTPILEIGITQARDFKSVQLFQKIVTRLFAHYMNISQDIEKEYIKFLGSNDASPLELRRMTRFEKTTGKAGIKILRERAPDVFVTAYASGCVKQRQPMMIDESEVDDYKKDGKKVLSFPKQPDPKYHFVCPLEDYPYPTIISNKKLPNKDIYPYLPCCNDKDPALDPTSLYYKVYVQNKTVKEITESEGKSQHIYKSERMVGYGREGNVPDIMKDLLQIAEPAEEIKRVGMVVGSASLLHACLFATKQKEYITLKTDEAREKFAQNYRKVIAKKIHLEVMAQEMWDLSPEERNQLFTKSEMFLDYRLVYRALEEFFNVALFVFEKKGDDVDLVQPRGFMFSARAALEDRESIIVYQHDIETSDTVFPQYELIIRKKGKQALQEPILTKKLYDTYSLLYKTVTTTIENNAPVTSINAPSLSLFMVSLQPFATHQILDSYGKLRGLVLEDPVTTVMCTPMQPLNLPQWIPLDAYPRKTSEKIIVKELLQGMAPHDKRDDKIIYYDTDDHHVSIEFLLPTKDDEEDETTVFDTLVHERDVVGFMLQLISTSFVIMYHGSPLIQTMIDSFLTKWTKIVKNVQYTTTHLTNPYIPPAVVKSVDHFLKWWSTEVNPSMIDATKIILPSKGFQTRVKEYLKRFIAIHSGDTIILPTVLVGVHAPEILHPNEMLLNEYSLSIYQYLKTRHNIQIQTAITSKSQYERWVMYKHDNQWFMIQNLPSEKEAIVTGIQWLQDYRNSPIILTDEGIETVDEIELDPEEYHIARYTLSNGGILVTNDKKITKDTLRLLSYGDGSSVVGLILPMD